MAEKHGKAWINPLVNRATHPNITQQTATNTKKSLLSYL
jgi:hypothetical protein